MVVDELGLREYLTSRGLGRKSIKDYVGAVLRADRWLSSQGIRLDDCSALMMSEYVSTQVPNSWSSRKQVRTALSLFWEKRGVDGPVEAIRVPPKPKFKCRAVEDHEARKLSDVAYHWEEGGEGVAVLLGMYVALRREEIAKVRWQDLNYSRQTITVIGKGDVIATLPLHQRVIDRLEWWRGFKIEDPTDCRTRPGSEYVFGGKRGGGVSPATIWEWCKRLAREAGIDNLTTHQLRHTCLATANDITQDLRGVMELARHSDPATTVLYTRVGMDRLRGIVGRLDY